jgi:SAM-dependent methyltransferase
MNPDLEWQRRYEENDTPWDKGEPAPALVDFLCREQITGQILVPGCGRGHEVQLLGMRPQSTVVGLDLSTTAIAQAREQAAGLKPAGEINFVVGDFFNLAPKLRGAFDWLVEHTCFCAIEPRLRPDYVLAAASALRAGGKIFGIFFINPDSESGPPFPVSREELSELFAPHFALLSEWVPTEAFPGREHRELVRVLQKREE